MLLNPSELVMDDFLKLFDLKIYFHDLMNRRTFDALSFHAFHILFSLLFGLFNFT